MADTYNAGKNGKLVIGSAEVSVKNWKVTHSIQELDVTSTTSGGKYEVQGGIEKLEGSFEADWDAANSPYSAGFGFVAGAKLANVHFDVDNGSGPNGYDITSAFVKNVDTENSVDAVVKYTVNFVSDGDFTLPS